MIVSLHMTIKSCRSTNVFLKRVLAKGVAKLFLLLKDDAYGGNKGVAQSVVPYVTLDPSQARNVSLFVNLDTFSLSNLVHVGAR